MIENINDFISLAVLIGVCAFMIFMFYRVLSKHRRRKLMHQEIEYYKEWK